MATMSTSFNVTGSFSLTDENGVAIFSYSPSFSTISNSAALSITTGQILVNTSASAVGGRLHNNDRTFVIVKNIDPDYQIAVGTNGQTGVIADLKPGEVFFSPLTLDEDGSGDDLTLTATTAAQKAEYLLCDAINA